MKKGILLFTGCLMLINYTIKAQDIVKATAGSIIAVQNGAVLYLNGGINLDNTSLLKNDGIITVARAGAGAANFTDNTSTTYTYGNGKFVFTGTGTQFVFGVNQFERIDVDDAGLNLLSSITANNWYLKTGKVNTGVFFAAAQSTAANAVQADPANTNFANSWFNGYLRRSISTATVNNYKFPVGDAVKVNMAEMDNLTADPLTAVNYVTASFGTKPGNDAGLNVSENGTAYSSVNIGGVWYLVPNANPGAGAYDLKLFFNGFPVIADNSFAILRRPDASSNAVDWMVPAGSILPVAGSLGRTFAGGYARRNKITTFSQFGLGISLAPLPIQLLSFTALKKDKTVLLQWTTSSENNSNHFELYKGGQPAALQYLDKVSAAGYSTTNRKYSYIDKNPLQGSNFYHLKMVDNDNSYKLSQVVRINFDDIVSFNVYPNPVTNNILFVDYTGSKVQDIKLIATDGKQITCSFSAQNNNHLKVLIPAVLAKGTYILQLNTKEALKNVMVVIQ